MFEQIEPPERLVYTWSLESRAAVAERVSVQFAPLPDGATEVIVTHERIGDESARSGHERGWGRLPRGSRALRAAPLKRSAR